MILGDAWLVSTCGSMRVTARMVIFVIFHCQSQIRCYSTTKSCVETQIFGSFYFGEDNTEYLYISQSTTRLVQQ